MSSLWSTTRSAVNNGYGMSGFARIGLPNPFYKPRPWGIPAIHPELLDKPPYAQADPVHNLYTRPSGGSLVKGSSEAKARMAYLRSLRGRGCGGKKALGGYKPRPYVGIPELIGKKKALKGGDEFFSTLLSSLGGTAMNAIKNLALQTGASITELLADPKTLIQNLMVFAPAAARAVKNFFSGKSKKDKGKTNRQKYLQMLKKYDPKLYEKKRRQALRQHYERMKQQYEQYNDNDDEDDDENDDVDNEKNNIVDDDDEMMDIPPIPKKTPKKKKSTTRRKGIYGFGEF